MCPTNRDSVHGLWKHISGSNDPSRLEQAFGVLDTDGDGEIKSSDLAAFFSSCLGQPISEEDVNSMIAMADLDGNGAVNLEEFQRLMTEGINGTAAAKVLNGSKNNALREMFGVLDADKDGVLSVEDLRSAMEVSGQPVSEEDLEGMIVAAGGGSNKDRIDFESFARLMRVFN